MKLPELTTKLIAIIVGATLVLLLAVFAVSQWRKAHTASTVARVEKGQEEAAVASGQEAMNTVSAVETNAAETRQIVKEATHEVEQAPDGDSNDAADRATCRLRLYVNSERCAALRKADPGKPTRRDTGR